MPCARSTGPSILLLEEKLAATSDGTSSLGGDETALLTAGGVSSRRGGVTDVLMVTTTMGMLDGVHSNTSNSWPVSLLGVSSVVGAVGSEERFVSSLATGDDANHSSATSKDRLTDTRWESDTGLLAILGVTDHDGGGTRGTGKSATVSEFSLNIGDNGTLRHLVDREDITDSEGGY